MPSSWGNLVLRHDSFEDCPLTYVLSPEGERKLPSPLLCKGEGQGEGSSCSRIIPHHIKCVAALALVLAVARMTMPTCAAQGLVDFQETPWNRLSDRNISEWGQ